jgi:hypothetical protein
MPIKNALQLYIASSNFLCNFSKTCHMQPISMLCTILSYLHSSGKPPNKMLYSTRGHLYMNMIFHPWCTYVSTARTEQAMGYVNTTTVRR